MQKRVVFAFLAYGRGMKLMYVSLDEAFDDEVETPSILSRNGRGDFGCTLVDNRAAVTFLIDVGISLHVVFGGVSEGGWVGRLGEGQFKAVVAGTHLMNLEGDFTGPVDALE